VANAGFAEFTTRQIFQVVQVSKPASNSQLFKRRPAYFFLVNRVVVDFFAGFRRE